ncbi:MAG: helix-turn-helix transcriptional regulator [Algicola sp.]|nr:helix-turn-helix transcriptional regulator [Algicola sp.]
MKKVLISYDYSKTFATILKEKLNVLNVKFTIAGHNEIMFDEDISATLLDELESILKPYAISIIDDKNQALVERIKSVINNMLDEEQPIRCNTSDYLSETLNYSYAYLSSVFSETTYTSIESFIILCKVDKAKDLLLRSNLTLTEIAYRLKYSSVAHLSRQFKKTTGMTPSAFQQIIQKRKELINS